MTEDLLGLAQETIVQVREISECLRPGLLDHFGLVTALRVALKEFAGRTGIVVTMSPDELELHLSQSQATGVYRICQEALTNVIKHAGEGAKVIVAVSWVDDEVTLTVTDRDGEGTRTLDPDAEEPLSGLGLGLIGMRERAELIGATFDAGETEDGFRVRTIIPLAASLEETHA